MYYIEKNIPLPSCNVTKPRGPLRLTLEKMEIGDSILINSSKRATAYATAKDAGIKIKTTIQEDDYLRIWRVK